VTGTVDRRLSVAPMMDCTDRHERSFLRILSQRLLLYTEMVTGAAISNGNRHNLLAFPEEQHPLALQLGGSDPIELGECARIAQDYGYDEINLNVGCPSDRVQSGRFGACLMAEPGLVARCVEAMASACSVPVTVKTRIGIDHSDSYDFLRRFVGTVADAGCEVFIVHARKAWLQGLSPKENREIPPICHSRIYRLKEEFPKLSIVLNGGVKSLEETFEHLQRVDGVMIGREAYHNPYMLARADRDLYGLSCTVSTREEILNRFLPYVERELAGGVRLWSIARHLLGLFHGMPGAKAWRRRLSEEAVRPGAGARTLLDAVPRTGGPGVPGSGTPFEGLSPAGPGK
jgi:tRNA-dihydrouridine synthase A